MSAISKAIEQAAQAERAAIVKKILEWADEYGRLGLVFHAQAMNRAANAIERGDHLT